MFRWMVVVCCSFSWTVLNGEVQVLALSGSSRGDSVNRKLLMEAVDIARQLGAKVSVADLKDYPMPFYDADLESKDGMPEKAREFRELMLRSKVVLIATPEYNSSIPAILKNALDWASREEGKGSRRAYQGKVFVLLSASPGRTGGARGLIHLRAVIQDVGGEVIEQQLSLPDAYNAFDEQGHLKNPRVKMELQQLMQSALNEQDSGLSTCAVRERGLILAR